MEYFDMLHISEAFLHEIAALSANYRHQDFVREVRAVANLSGFPFEKIFFLNFMYEYSTIKACTGILIRNSEGRIFHGRNLDFEMWEILAKLVTNVQYHKGGKLLYSVDTVVGSVFALTGIRHGAFAINVDTRKQTHIYDDIISVLVDGAMPTCWLLRKTLEQETSYSNALQRLKSEKIGGPVYYVVSGVKDNEGCVIEREPESVHAFYELSETNWFIIQTNYDRDYPDPLHDPRRIPVEKRMHERGNKNFDEHTLINEFMSIWPSFNIATIMTAIMIPATGYHNTTVWYGQNPKNLQVA